VFTMILRPVVGEELVVRCQTALCLIICHKGQTSYYPGRS
jgi:hypothetical protein